MVICTLIGIYTQKEWERGNNRSDRSFNCELLLYLELIFLFDLCLQVTAYLHKDYNNFWLVHKQDNNCTKILLICFSQFPVICFLSCKIKYDWLIVYPLTSSIWDTRSYSSWWHHSIGAQRVSTILHPQKKSCYWSSWFSCASKNLHITYFFPGLWRTTRNLHTHLHQAPMTKKHFQVTGYGVVSKQVIYCSERLTMFVFFLFFSSQSHIVAALFLIWLFFIIILLFWLSVCYLLEWHRGRQWPVAGGGVRRSEGRLGEGAA